MRCCLRVPNRLLLEDFSQHQNVPFVFQRPSYELRNGVMVCDIQGCTSHVIDLFFHTEGIFYQFVLATVGAGARVCEHWEWRYCPQCRGWMRLRFVQGYILAEALMLVRKGMGQKDIRAFCQTSFCVSFASVCTAKSPAKGWRCIQAGLPEKKRWRARIRPILNSCRGKQKRGWELET